MPATGSGWAATSGTATSRTTRKTPSWRRRRRISMTGWSPSSVPPQGPIPTASRSAARRGRSGRNERPESRRRHDHARPVGCTARREWADALRDEMNRILFILIGIFACSGCRVIDVHEETAFEWTIQESNRAMAMEEQADIFVYLNSWHDMTVGNHRS